MRELVQNYLDGGLSRRGFLGRLVATGLTVAAAEAIADATEPDLVAPDTPRYRPVTGTGGDLLAEQIKAAGTRFIFTNPGSFEVGFFDALTDRPELQVIVGLHEGIVIPMADGYHKVTGQPAFVNVHAIAGTAQMAGQLYNSHRDGSALVVTAGMVDPTTFSDDVRLAARQGFDQTDVNRQFTKLSWNVRNAASVPMVTRRAFKVAGTAPGGPVYVCYGTAALESKGVTGDIWPREAFMLQARPRPATDQIEQLAKSLVEADRPILIAGDEVWKANAQAELVYVCELLGLPASVGAVPGSPTVAQAFCNFPTSHPQYVGAFTPLAPYEKRQPDVVFEVGTRGDLSELTLPPKPTIDQSTRVFAAGIDTATLGRTQPLDLGIVADVRETLKDLATAVSSFATAARLKEIRQKRLAIVTAFAREQESATQAAGRSNFDKRPIHPDRIGYEINRALRQDAIIVSENLTASNQFFKLGFREDEKVWLSTTGNSLGWGVGAAIGAKIGAPDRQVLLSIGDGSVMYSASGFWSMARYGVPVLVVVWNNYNYQTVRERFHTYSGRMATTGHYHGMYLGDPEIDFVKLAESQGVRGEKVTEPGDIAAALTRGTRATDDGRPYLVEIITSRVGNGADSRWHQKFNLAAERKQSAR